MLLQVLTNESGVIFDFQITQVTVAGEQDRTDKIDIAGSELRRV